MFYLIKSLNKNEKGYIKKTAFKQGVEGSNFIKLFNAIDRQTAYDEKKLLKKEKYIKQLPRLKNYLYERILVSLEFYHSGNNKEIQLRHLLNRVQLLFDKGFYDQCKKLLNKAKETAILFERFCQLLEILEWERLLTIEKLAVNDLEQLSQLEMKVLAQLENIGFYKSAYDRVSLLYTKTILIRNDRENWQFKKIISGKYFENEKNATSITAKILLFKTIGKYLSALDDKKNYLHYARKAVELMEHNPEYTNQNVLQYIKVLNNLIVTLGENKKIEERWKAVQKLKNIPEDYPSANNEKIRSIIFMRSLIRDFYFFQSAGEFDKSFQLVSSIEEGLQRYHHLISTTHTLMFYYSISYSCFIEGKYKKSLDWINKIINAKLSVETIAFHNYSRILNMIIHYELKNFDLLEYLIRSTRKFLGKQQKLYGIEQAFIVCMEKIILHRSSDLEERLIFQDFRNYLDRMKDPLEKNILEYFDFPAWIESKIQHRTFLEILVRNRVSGSRS